MSAWLPKIAIAYTHRFPEDGFKIDVSIKKFLRKVVVSTKVDEATKERVSTGLIDLVPVPFLGVLVDKVTGPLETGASSKVDKWIEENAPILHTSSPTRTST